MSEKFFKFPWRNSQIKDLHMAIGHFLVAFHIFHIECRSTNCAFQTSFVPKLEQEEKAKGEL